MPENNFEYAFPNVKTSASEVIIFPEKSNWHHTKIKSIVYIAEPQTLKNIPQNCCISNFKVFGHGGKRPIENNVWAYLLSHLSRRLTGELIVYPVSGIRRPSSSSVVSIFPSIKAKFYMEHP